MTTQPNYSKIYTHAPEQHPNLILGSLQLLFWMFFRPTALRNHLKRIHPVLETNTSLITVLRRENVILKNPALRKFILQGFVISPVGMTVVARIIIFLFSISFGTPLLKAISSLHLAMAFALIGVVIGVVVCLFVNLAEAVVYGVVFSVGLGVVEGIYNWLLDGVVVSVEGGVAFVLASCLLLGALYTIGSNVVFTLIYATVLLLLVRTLGIGLFFVIGVIIASWRPNIPNIFSPLLIPWNSLLYGFEQRRTSRGLSLLRFHPAFWYERLDTSFPELDKHLLLVIERNPEEGKAAMNYLSTTDHRSVVQAVQIELDARRLEACQDVNDISEITSRLEVSSESPIDSILNNLQCISKDTKAALEQRSNYNQRLRLKPISEKLQAQTESLNRSYNKYAPRFQPIAIKWHDIITKHIEELTRATELFQEIDNPYIIGIPLNEKLSIFTGRTNTRLRIEQLLLDRRRPPLLLYGQRRMGKTSLLNNLGKLLPNSIIPMFVDLQGSPSSAKDSTGFLYNLAKQMINSAKRQSAVILPPLTRETLENDPFTNFDEWLDKVEETLEQNTALLMLDEFEALDSAINKGRFDEKDVLGMLRHLIQHRPKFKVLIAGSHTIEEYQRWASYLINVQVVGISYLLEHEARKLIVNPIEDFKLRYEADAVERILQLTRCHPFLVQLLCSELVALKNEQDPSVRRLATLADVEATIPEALSTGGFFFADIQNNQVDATGLEILRFIAAKKEKAVVSEKTLALEFQERDYYSAIVLLLQRELIEEVDDGYCFQVELIRRWFENKNKPHPPPLLDALA